MEEKKEREELFSKRLRAGKRTYFFDVKADRSDEFYLTITESKKRFGEDGPVYEKHKLFLYKEDFEKFTEALAEAVAFIEGDQADSVKEIELDEVFNSEEPDLLDTDDGFESKLSWD